MSESPSSEELFDFPCDYIFKAFGPTETGTAFKRNVLDAANRVMPVAQDALKQRQSSAGRYVCVSLVVRVHNREQIEAVYRELRQVEGLLYLL